MLYKSRIYEYKCNKYIKFIDNKEKNCIVLLFDLLGIGFIIIYKGFVTKI